MLKIYGSMLCPDCVKCREELDRAAVPYAFFDFAQDLANLKAFLLIRDQDPLFDDAKGQGKIGIPCIVKPDGTICLTWEEFM